MRIFYENRAHPLTISSTQQLVFLPHLHHHVELVLVHRGSLAMEVDGQPLLLAPGDLAIVFPEMVHSYQGGRPGNTTLAIFGTGLAPDYARTLTAMQPTLPFLPAARVHQDIPYALAGLHAEMAGQPDHRMLKNYISMLCGRVLEQLALAARPEGANADLMSRLLLYLDEHFREPLTLEWLAAEMNVSKYHLSHQFSQKMRCTLRHYINALRAERAKELLLDTALPVTAVGYEAGFESSSTFYREFVRHIGQPPGAYRKGGGGGSTAAGKAGAPRPQRAARPLAGG